MDLHNVETMDFSQYEKVLIGASIRYGHLNNKLYQFIERNLTQLEQNKVAFFCVNLTARKEDQGKDTPEGSAYIRKFLIKSPLEANINWSLRWCPLLSALRLVRQNDD